MQSMDREINRLRSFYLIKDEQIPSENKVRLARKGLHMLLSWPGEIRCIKCRFTAKLRETNFTSIMEHACISRWRNVSHNEPIPSPFSLDNAIRDENIIYKEFRLATFRRIPNAAITLDSGSKEEMAERGLYYYKVNQLRCCYCKHILPFDRLIKETDLAAHKVRLCNPRMRVIERKINFDRSYANQNNRLDFGVGPWSVLQEPPASHIERHNLISPQPGMNMGARSVPAAARVPPPEPQASSTVETYTFDDNKYECKICLANNIQVVFIPCGHFITCQSCAERVMNCPICRAKIIVKMRPFC